MVKQNFLGFFFGGLLPVIIFTIIEDNYGTWAGLIAGLIFGVCEIIFEFYKYKKISRITWFGNGMLIFLGLVSLVLADGLWFKLQPAIIEAFFGFALWFSLMRKKNLLQTLMEMQNQKLPDVIKYFLNGICFRTGLFFLIHAGLATWAALYWSTTSWALLKGIGLTVSFIFYLLCEGFTLRYRIKNSPEIISKFGVPFEKTNQVYQTSSDTVSTEDGRLSQK